MRRSKRGKSISQDLTLKLNLTLKLIGSLRVYYDVEEDPEPKVSVLAVGIKVGSRVRIGREIVKL